MSKNNKNMKFTMEFKSHRRLPMPPPTRAIPMRKQNKLDKIIKREMMIY